MAKFDVDLFRTQLKLAKCRLENLIKQHRNTQSNRRREIATLIQQGHEDRARTKYLIRDDYLVEAYDMLITFCEDLAQSSGLIAREPTMDVDLLPAAKSLIFASGRVAVEELDRIQTQLMLKYGKDFVDVNSEFGKTLVDPSLMVKLTMRTPNASLINRYMATIAEIYGVVWNAPEESSPTAGEAPLINIDSPTTSQALPPPPAYHDAVRDISGSPSPAQQQSSQNASSGTPDFDELQRRFQALKDAKPPK